MEMNNSPHPNHNHPSTVQENGCMVLEMHNDFIHKKQDHQVIFIMYFMKDQITYLLSTHKMRELEQRIQVEPKSKQSKLKENEHDQWKRKLDH